MKLETRKEERNMA